MPAPMPMRHGTGSSTHTDTARAVTEAVTAARAGLAGAPATVACVFLTPHHAEAAEAAVERLHALARPGTLLGCTAENLIAGPREIEGGAAVTVWLGHWPGARVDAFHLRFDEDAAGFAGWPAALPLATERPAFLVLADPFTLPADDLVTHLNHEFPGCPAFGGLASGGWSPGMNRILVGDAVHTDGAAVAVVTGDIRVETIVSQGCRPIGKPLVITRADRNLLLTLGGKPALEQLRAVFADLTPPERELAQSALHVGQVIDERKPAPARGDFLIRNVMGIDPTSGAIAITDVIRPGRTVQFHVRDAASAREDLRHLLAGRAARGPLPPGAGVLFVSCNGRGSRLFGACDVDAGAVPETLGTVPTAGFFAAGEIGPVGGRNFLHGFTASVAVFSPGESPAR